jgi:hypothetical protein
LTLFVGLAAAQTTGGGTALTCNTVAQVTPTIRAEGITELVGDIVITCQGGTYVAPGTAIPQGNIAISLTNVGGVTSRLTTANASTYVGANGVPSEAILMIDEPHSGLTGPVAKIGPSAPLNVCSTPATGCAEYATQVTGTDGVSQYIVATDNVGDTVAGRNVFQGNVNVSTVTFQGIPFLPPVTSGVVRVYRITNIRVNASGSGASFVSGTVPIVAYISTNGASTLPINANTAGVTVAFATPSMVPTVTNTKTAFTLCATPSPNPGQVASLNFAENFPSAFKTRIAPFGTTGTSYLGTSSSAYYQTINQQNIPGQLYSSESGFLLPVTGVPNAGMADSGTRFKAVFQNLPTGATIYVSSTNTNAGTGVTGGYNITQPSIALLTTGGEAGVFTATSATQYALTRAADGTASAVWEVVNTNTSANETFQFGVYISYAANNPPVPMPGGVTPNVTLSYAPTTTSSWIPRFLVGAVSTATPITNNNVTACQTLLLFPYVTSQGGFDTGIAIANTSQDPWSTPTSSGTCTLNFYGLHAPAAVTIGSIVAGNPDPTQSSLTASSVAPNFTGYMFATCNFQYAHGLRSSATSARATWRWATWL